MRTAIMGEGVVGKALSKVLDNPIIYDPPKKIGSLEELGKADVIFVCVPTPYIKGIGRDISLVEKSVSLLNKKVIVIKSTVIPGTTDELQEKYPNNKILFNPEFLTEKNAEQDMKYPDRQIIGYTKKSKRIAKDIMDLLSRAPYEKIMPAAEAEMIKYYTNSFLALKVVFANQIYDLCKKAGIDYGQVKEGLKADKRIGKTHLEIFVNGKRGADGKCFPKDIKALIEFSKQKKVVLSILREADKYNNNLIKWKE